jgi:hypothetical protein
MSDPSGWMTTVNDGPDIVSSTYWGSEMDEAGLIGSSVNAGYIRLLLPRRGGPPIKDITHGVRYVILSRGPWHARGLTDAFELIFEDGSQAPYALQLAPETFDVLPAEPEPGQAWRLSVWTEGPTKRADYEVRYRRVGFIPWLKEWPE